ncbi:Antigen Sm21.7 [Fasciola gigantica]|uniref:Antigen Sm21.7 n=1 Tax=Fasciola gigantica TaxID=46835 RepID=A0A504Z3Y4_FASGI|nr:Antigen Sm21.7 [Fasciola gigantica]
MDAFIEAYFAVDVDHSGTITTDELQQYMIKNDMDLEFIKRWQQLFDPENSGVITLEKFCDVLGLELESVREKYDTSNQQAIKPVEFEEISADIDEKLKPVIASYAAEGTEIHGENDRELVKWIKLRMDKEHGRLWHCMIIRGQYFSYYSYQPGYSFCFKIGNRIFIVFKTPYC